MTLFLPSTLSFQPVTSKVSEKAEQVCQMANSHTSEIVLKGTLNLIKIKKKSCKLLMK